MKKMVLSVAVLALATGLARSQAAARAERPARDVAQHLVEGWVDVYGYLENRQFLYPDGHEPALVGRTLELVLVFSEHTRGFFAVHFSAEPADGPWVSLLGGPPTKILVGPAFATLGPFEHDGVEARLSVAIPPDQALLGQPWCAQALVGGGFLDLSSGVRGVIGNVKGA